MRIRNILVGILILTFSCCKESKLDYECKNFEFYEGFTLSKDQGFEYSKQCVFKIRENKFIVQEYRRYNHNGLISSYSCLTEGKLDNQIDNRKEKLILKDDKLIFENKEFEVLEIYGDSIIGKNDEIDIVVVIKHKSRA